MNELMTKVVEMINLAPKKWNQSSWVSHDEDDVLEMCNTTMCIAGWAMLLSGKVEQKVWMDENNDGTKYVSDVQLVWPGEVNDYGEEEIVTESEYKEMGAELLGLNDVQAHNIFMFTKTKDPQIMTNHIKGVLAGTMQHDIEDPCTC